MILLVICAENPSKPGFVFNGEGFTRPELWLTGLGGCGDPAVILLVICAENRSKPNFVFNGEGFTRPEFWLTGLGRCGDRRDSPGNLY